MMDREDRGMEENRRFNRRESATDHQYCGKFGFNPLAEFRNEGLIKVKLAHGSSYSVVVPDALYVGAQWERWIQPLAFHANVIHFLEEDPRCRLYVDISCGQTVLLEFREADHVRRLDDGSQLYRCIFWGPEDLDTYATGRSKNTADGRLWHQLFHHTTPENKEAILASGHFRLSSWNIQGTKRLANVGFAYFTPLDEIRFDSDLKCIAMATDGKMSMLVDGVDAPLLDSAEIRRQLKRSLLDITVYRESTRNRTAVLTLWVEATALASQHMWRHSPPNQAVFFEIAAPFIQRVGMSPGNVLPFMEDTIPAPSSLKTFDYVVIGDARIKSGLAAPFDEENTRHLLKIERVAAPSNLFRFWRDHANTDLLGPKDVALRKFESS
jgi:hypothetical protein